MRGKKICNTLKQVRSDIARANSIKYEVTECTHKGDCLGTCPKCEAEVKYLEKQLELRRRKGLKVTLAGVSAGLVAISATSCANPFAPATAGDMQAEPGLREVTETDLVLGSMELSPETETDAVDGDIDIPGEIAAPDKTDDTELIQGIVPAETDTELVLEGDVAYFPEDTEPFEDVLVAGMMVAPEVYLDGEPVTDEAWDAVESDVTESAETAAEEPETTAE